MTIERIVVGLDGSEGSADALRWAIDLAKVVGAEIVAVHAFEVPVPLIAPPAAGVPVGMSVDEVQIEEELRQTAEEAFTKAWSAPLDDAGVRFRRVLAQGPPGDVLLDVAERERAGLLVTGRRGRGGLAALLGSVGTHLVHRSRIPVTVVPAAGDREGS